MAAPRNPLIVNHRSRHPPLTNFGRRPDPASPDQQTDGEKTDDNRNSVHHRHLSRRNFSWPATQKTPVFTDRIRPPAQERSLATATREQHPARPAGRKHPTRFSYLRRDPPLRPQIHSLEGKLRQLPRR